MKRIIIVQARMTSSRLPGKVLMDLAGRPMLAQQLRRLKRCRTADDVIVATTVNRSDDPVVALAEEEGVRWFRGSEHDVLSRYVAAARDARADVVARVTGDCPLIDPAVTDRVIDELVEHAGACDYASNVVPRTFPRGLDVEVLFFDSLLRLDRLASTAAAREHITVFIIAERPDLFLRRSVVDDENNADLRWCVDTAPDLDLVRALYTQLDLATEVRSYQQVVAHMRANPELARVNFGIRTWDPLDA